MKSPFIEFCRKTQIESIKKQMEGQSLPEGVAVFNDIRYAHDANRFHTLDIYVPSEVKDLLPIVVVAHGGAFIGGDKSFNKEYGMRLALQGYCVININYDLAPEATLLEMVRTLSDAMIWINRYAEKYHGDLKNVYGLGDSAGAWLVLTYSIVNKNKLLREKYEFPVKNPINFTALVLVCPVCNIKTAMGPTSKIKWFKRYIFKNGTKDNNYSLTSIQDLVRYILNLQNVLIITTPNDEYYYQSIELKELFVNNKIKHTFLEVKSDENELGHCFNIIHPQYKESAIASERTCEFFLRNKK